VLVYKKVNSHLLHPSTGQRLRYGQRRSSTASGRPKTLSFGAAAITAFVGFRVCQLLVRCFKKRKPTQQEQEELLIQQALQQQQMQQVPPLVSCCVGVCGPGSAPDVCRLLCSCQAGAQERYHGKAGDRNRH
jgi:hypothetical protein